MNDFPRSRAHSGALLDIGDLVILADGQRATVKQAVYLPTELHYMVALSDGSDIEVEAGGLIRAKTYANWVAPGSGWDGRERRQGEREPQPRVDWPGEERRRT